MQMWIVLWTLLMSVPAPPSNPVTAVGPVDMTMVGEPTMPRYRGLEALLAKFEARSPT